MPIQYCFIKKIKYVCVEDICNRIREILNNFYIEISIFLKSAFERFLHHFTIKSLMQNDWKYPKNDPSSLQQCMYSLKIVLISRDSKNKEEIMKTVALDVVPSYGLFTFFSFFFNFYFNCKEKFFKTNEFFELNFDLLLSGINKITSFYLNLDPAKQKITYYINDLIFALDKSIILYFDLIYNSDIVHII